MTEKDIENLIARHPDNFFSNEGLELVGQQVALGRCRADIIFQDKHKRKIIVEVKRGILSREAAGQIMEYYGLLKETNPHEIIELVLCANVVPAERKTFLERAGIECKEIGVSTIINLAKEKKYQFLDESKNTKNETITHPKELIPRPIDPSKGENVWIFQAKPERCDILNALADPKLIRQKWTVNPQYKNKIRNGDWALIWISGKEAGIYAMAKIVSDPDIMTDFPYEEKYWVNQEDRGQKKLRVIIEIVKDLRNKPIFRSNIKTTPGLENLYILRFSQGANSPVTKEEWVIIKNVIEQN